MRRYTTMFRVATLTVVVAAGVAGCGSSRSILYKGIAPGALGKRIVISDARAVRDGSSIRSQWLACIARAGRKFPEPRFHNLSASVLRARLAAAAARYHFTVKDVQFLHPRQVAPLVIVQTRNYLALAHAWGNILYKSLDPLNGYRRLVNGHRPPKETFEAFFFEAQDERGVPFIITSYDARAQLQDCGGMWARSEELYPFAHG